MKRATKEVLYFETGPDNEPTLYVDPGEEFEVETQMNRGPCLDSHPERETLEKKLISGNPSRMKTRHRRRPQDRRPGVVRRNNGGRSRGSGSRSRSKANC